MARTVDHGLLMPLLSRHGRISMTGRFAALPDLFALNDEVGLLYTQICTGVTRETEQLVHVVVDLVDGFADQAEFLDANPLLPTCVMT